jgi:hypothetical protein
MSACTTPEIQATVTNHNTGGQWIVIQSITTWHGPFSDQSAAEEFARSVTGSEDSIVWAGRDGRTE